MDRRNFLRRAGALSIPLVAGMPGIRAASNSIFTSILPPNSSRVLVLVQLNGGNDGLNTLVPVDQLSQLQQVRTNVFQPQSSLRAITTSLALHSRMEGMQQLFNAGKMSIVQDVGYPNQNRSHFRSSDIWTTGSDATTELETGWLGRTLEQDFQGYPENFPNPSKPHPPAISMGNSANATCQGLVTNMSQTVNNPFNLTFLAPGGDTPVPQDNYGDELSFLRTAIEQTNEYGTVIQDAANAGNTVATYPDNSNLANQLRNVARLISGGLQTQVYVVQHNGFDTHAGQVENNTVTNGRHANLVGELSAAITAFQDDLEQLGLADRVMGMTFSEFGRRIRSNDSMGTDHGTAAPMFLFGNCVSGSILGQNPTIDTQVDQNEGVPMQYDFRDVYGSVLTDWFEVPESEVRDILYPDFVRLPVADGCASSLPVDLLDFTAVGQEKTIEVRWQTTREENNEGFDVERSIDGRNFTSIAFVPAVGVGASGVRSYELEDRDVTTGPLYYYRLKQRDRDGSFEYSSIRSARLKGSAIGQWSVGHAYPNPAVDQTTVQIYSPTDAGLTYSVFNAAGQRVLIDSTQLIGSRDNQVTVRLGRLPAGAYSIRFATDKGNSETRKIMVR